MLTLFSTPKPFVGHIRVIQENAILSWKRLIPSCEVILLGNDAGTAEAAEKFGCMHVPDVRCSEYGTPLISALFSEAQKHAGNGVMCYANCDIMFTNALMEAVQLVKGRKRFLLVGQRYNVDLDFPWDFDDAGWGQNLLDYAHKHGELNSPRGIDYFMFPKGQYPDIPDLTVGRAWWDNWMIYNTKRQFIPLLDGTGMILAVHQNHDYSHCKGGQEEAYHRGPEVRKNLTFVDNGHIDMTIEDAEWVLEKGEIRFDFRRTWRHFNQLPFILPWLKGPVRGVRMILKPAQKIGWLDNWFQKMFRRTGN